MRSILDKHRYFLELRGFKDIQRRTEGGGGVFEPPDPPPPPNTHTPPKPAQTNQNLKNLKKI